MQSYNTLVNVGCCCIIYLVVTALQLNQKEAERAIDHYGNGCTYQETVLNRQT